MTILNVEKRLGSPPASLQPNTLYFINNNDELEIYLSDAVGKHAITTRQFNTSGGNTNDVVITLITTKKIPIIDNRIELPSKPEGGVAMNVMFVYDDYDVVTIYDNVSIETEGGLFYAKLAGSESILGTGKVSYCIRT